jgi:YbbR domain-containing protein
MMQTILSYLSKMTSVILALILAVIIWATAVRANDPEETSTLEVPIEVVGTPPDAELVNRPPDVVRLTIQGPGSSLENVSPDDYRALIDLSDVPYGDTTVQIQLQGDVELVEVVSWFPEDALIEMEQIVTREIPIAFQVRGEVARGHRIGDERVEPESVQITGPAPRVDQIAEGRVIVFVDDAREDITEQRRPTYYDTQGNVASVVGLTVEPSEVEAIIPVEELAGFAEKPITVDWIGEPAPGYRLLDVSVDPSSVQVTGLPTTLDALRVQTEPVDISGLTETEIRQVTLDLPDGVQLVDIQPVIVSVEIEPILSSSVVQRPIEVRALGEGLEATLDPEEIRVFLFGPLPVLDTLAEDDVRVTVDLLNLITGTHVLEPFVSVSAEDVEVRSTQPSRVTVVISGVLTTTEEITETLSTRINASPSNNLAGQIESDLIANSTVASANSTYALIPAGVSFAWWRRLRL